MLKSLAQLVRLPNVFTAPADVIAGAALAGLSLSKQTHVTELLLTCLASMCVYAGGMIMNDLVDFQEDSHDRPERPLPSGRVTFALAIFLMLALFCLGAILSSASWPYLTLVVTVTAYNVVLKRFFIGPLAMGLCRGFNLILGAAIINDLHPWAWWGFWTMTTYITGVTVMARDETVASQKSSIRMGIGLVVVAIISLGTMAVKDYTQTSRLHIIFVVTLLAAWGLNLVWGRLYPAYVMPVPVRVQAAVKAGIMGVVVMEAFHASIELGWPGFLVLLLLLPAMLLGRYIYST
jgi:4-hydroxybenzoate polyprenyltransferase